jgi:HAD superfamily hydrolase (TIGR01509 family)
VPSARIAGVALDRSRSKFGRDGRDPLVRCQAHPGDRVVADDSARDRVAKTDRWLEISAAIEATVEILRELRERDVGLYALSNWSPKTFSIARPMFPFLEWFDGIVISGEVNMIKPDPRISAHVVEKFGLQPRATVFVDDNPENVRAAELGGFIGIVF